MGLSSALSKWNREIFGHLFQKKKRILARIGGIQKACDRYENPFLIKLEAELIHDYESILNQENLFWKQKSRDKWLQGGDRNTKFFHLTTLVRRRKNKIEGLFDSNGNWFTDSASMKNIAVDFFTNLFSSPIAEDTRFIIPWLFPEIDQDVLNNICKPVSLLEVKDSLFAIGGLKAPGFDGFPAIFFQYHWQLYSCEISNVVNDAFRSGVIPPGLNHTIISLIPKVNGPQHMTNFRPISLCTTIYKVISKVIVAQIRPLMQHLLSPNQAYTLKSCLDAFCSLSGQTVSYEKSLIFCSPNTCKRLAYEISRTCGSPLTTDLGKYLGMPLIHSRVNKHTYDSLFDKVQSRLSSWKSKVLSMAGRLTLLQSVTYSIPIYAMQTAKLPVSLCDRIDKLNRDFLWGDSNENKKVHLVGWETVCQPKKLGGLGIKKTADMNQAMLAKASWRLFQHDSGLWASIYSEKYLKNCCITGDNYLPPPDCSSTWRSISYGAVMLRKNLKWRVGDGKKIKFWYDYWLLPTALINFALPSATINDNATICEFWDETGWDALLLASVVPSDLVSLIINVPTGFDGCGNDVLIWNATSNGCFSVKSAYDSMLDINGPCNPH
ncbi:uncharacterized protein LOC112198716 [Rosa chinensis]|uniref:uncharacterized protein LOC112198716 n=1 Tax=Rosa chinensis TaxID=74649 RepID=UPI000D08CB7D|nr:uncharacterized protein LOC112198716 [Rosa chinensis]